MKDLDEEETVQAKKKKNYIVDIIPPKKVIYVTRSERHLCGLIPIREDAFLALLRYAVGYRIFEIDQGSFKTNEFITPMDSS